MIPVVDLFAGPGGLSEGFASCKDANGRRVFRVCLSVEMNEWAHKTLRLRSFFRQFDKAQVPDEYYDVLRGVLPIEDLYSKYKEQADASSAEAWLAELGKVDPEEVDKRISRVIGDEPDWVLIGGPPCQAYSVAGRSRVKPVDPEGYERDHRHFLYREYLRILAFHQPPVFVMENVKGILSSTVRGTKIVDQIIADLKHPLRALAPRWRDAGKLQYDLYPLGDYGSPAHSSNGERSPSDYIIMSEMHGIPQARHRFILLGVRSDLTWQPNTLRNLKKPIPVWKAIGDLPPLRSMLSRTVDSPEFWRSAVSEVVGQVAKLNGAIDPDVTRKLTDSVASLRKAGSGAPFIEWDRPPKWQRNWFHDPCLRGVCNHESRSHMKQDLWRYIYAACFATVNKRAPMLRDFPKFLWPDHENVKKRSSREELPFDDRFRVQLKRAPSTTVTSHIAKDGHYFIHPDPRQCRSLTVREAARLQTFPDNYFFLGDRTTQYQQVGNAVPPLLASKIARILAEMFESEDSHKPQS